MVVMDESENLASNSPLHTAPLHSGQYGGQHNGTGQQNGQMRTTTRPVQCPAQWPVCGENNGKFNGQYNGMAISQHAGKWPFAQMGLGGWGLGLVNLNKCCEVYRTLRLRPWCRGRGQGCGATAN